MNDGDVDTVGLIGALTDLSLAQKERIARLRRIEQAARQVVYPHLREQPYTTDREALEALRAALAEGSGE